MKNRIQKYSGIYTCVICGKKTRDTGNGEGSTVYGGEGLCRNCYEEAEYENEHSDYGHEVFEPRCPTCRAELEELK